MAHKPKNMVGMDTHCNFISVLLTSLLLMGTLMTQAHGFDGEQTQTGERRIDGYRGIWFSIITKYSDVPRYSGGLGTYGSPHVPMAVHCPEVNKTFFTYGGTASADSRHLLIVAGSYDHATGEASVPVVIYDKLGVDDPHDNGTMQVDSEGYLWFFVSGRSNLRPGFIYRSNKPWSLDDGFTKITSMKMAYPQPWYIPGKGFLFLFTRYVGGEGGPDRQLWWKTSPDGMEWSEAHLLSDFAGHYQVSDQCGDRVGTFFNWHPHSVNPDRTNLYYLETSDGGETWTTVDGTPVDPPLQSPDNPALVIDYYERGQRTYPCDINFDAAGNPAILYVTSYSGETGPEGDPREWVVTRWNGQSWETSIITTTTHNYDAGSLFINGDNWKIIVPSEAGPQPTRTGGEIAMWESADAGKTWNMAKQLTHDSKRNHGYVRRPVNAADPFFAYWADGDADNFSPSHLYFCDSEGKTVTELPYDMEGSPMVVRTPKQEQ